MANRDLQDRDRTLRLRDQCEHGRYEAHSWGYKPETDGTYGCPGGREVSVTEETNVARLKGPMRLRRRWVTVWVLDEGV